MVKPIHHPFEALFSSGRQMSVEISWYVLPPKINVSLIGDSYILFNFFYGFLIIAVPHASGIGTHDIWFSLQYFLTASFTPEYKLLL